MSDRSDYLALIRLRDNPDYKVLESKWLFKVSEIQAAREKAAKNGNESAWRYFAGQEKGAQIILLSLVMAIKELEDKDEELRLEKQRESLLQEIRGEPTL